MRMKILTLMGALLGLMTLVLIATAHAQDTFAPPGKAACEFWEGTSCARIGRPRTRIVGVPVLKPYRYVPEHLEPLHTRPQVRGWRMEADEGPACSSRRYEGASDEKIARDGEKQAVIRWGAMVRVKLGELYIDWKNAIDKRVQCFQSSPDERASDRAIGVIKGGVRAIGDAVTGREREDDDKVVTHTRCIVTARPCRAPVEYVKPESAR